jgi:formylglycine-generating enzyme required for sulfatase activity
MGSSFGDKDESLIRDVKINSFYMGKSEVTQYLWRKVMGNNPSYFKAPEAVRDGVLSVVDMMKMRCLSNH